MVKHEDERAFPVSVDMGDGRSATNLGMTLRDYFAAKAMQGMFANDAMITRYGEHANINYH